jgi:hypothetical protein
MVGGNIKLFNIDANKDIFLDSMHRIRFSGDRVMAVFLGKETRTSPLIWNLGSFFNAKPQFPFDMRISQEVQDENTFGRGQTIPGIEAANHQD